MVLSRFFYSRQVHPLRDFSASFSGTAIVAAEYFTNLCFRGHLKEALEKFRSELCSDPQLFSCLLKGCIAAKSISLGRQLHALITTFGCSSDKFISNHLLNMYSKFGLQESVIALFGVMPRKNRMSCNILIDGYIQNGDLEGARKVFNEMPDRNVPTWNAILTGLIGYEHEEEALSLFSEMYKSGFLPDEFTLGTILGGCAHLKVLMEGCQIHAYVTKSGLEFDLVVGCSLAHMYMKSGRLEDGEAAIKAMPHQSVVAWNTLIVGKAQNGFTQGALDHYRVMKMADFRPNDITFVSAVSSCSELATLGPGKQIHAEIIKAGLTKIAPVISSLVSMYSKCGCLDDSEQAFMEYGGVDLVLWTTMISAYGFHGRGEDAVELFERMEMERLEANEVTFLSLLYACSHCGLKDKGVELFYLMVEKYGVKPSLEHYTCMVDLLGRCGCLDEAEAMIRSMPLKADAVIWKTLLSACKIHKNAGMARRTATEVLQLDPQDPASFVLLSNIHASTRSWGAVSELRKVMKERKVQKEPGISWLEMGNKVHQFCMGDRTHPKMAEIDMYLEELGSELRLKGYVPDIDSALHDVDVEEKEDNLSRHSEKLAVAFGLLVIPGPAPVRVMKNLRICTDCHVAIKYISDLRNREIVVRDSSRFHHFKHGRCSCGDYW